MALEPDSKRASVFVDGQNLFHAAKAAFGYSYPNYDVKALAEKVCSQENWNPTEVRFYTGIPSQSDNPSWNAFWSKKFLTMKRQGILVYSRHLRYRTKTIAIGDGSSLTTRMPEEKGIDVRIAVDVIRGAFNNVYDVALIFSQDQDLSEVADEVRVISREQDRWIKVASAYPDSPNVPDQRGINKTDWIPIFQPTYNDCLDPRDYRSRK